MRCFQVRRLIEDYHYAELEEGRAAEVAEHLRGCAGCRHELALLEDEERIFEAYAARTEKALDIPAGMWERAVSGATPTPRREERRRANRVGWPGGILPASAWVRQGLAAALLIAVSVTATLLLVQHHRAEDAAVARQASIQAGAARNESLESALQSVQRAEQEYLNAIKVLDGIIEKQKPALDPALVAELQQNLKMIDQHIEATRKAYYEHPMNAELALYMLAAYSRKVELLQDLAS